MLTQLMSSSLGRPLPKILFATLAGSGKSAYFSGLTAVFSADPPLTAVVASHSSDGARTWPAPATVAPPGPGNETPAITASRTLAERARVITRRRGPCRACGPAVDGCRQDGTGVARERLARRGGLYVPDDRLRVAPRLRATARPGVKSAPWTAAVCRPEAVRCSPVRRSRCLTEPIADDIRSIRSYVFGERNGVGTRDDPQARRDRRPAGSTRSSRRRNGHRARGPTARGDVGRGRVEAPASRRSAKVPRSAAVRTTSTASQTGS